MSSETLKLATVLQNPGEPQIRTPYSDPYELKRLGYSGLVFYETTALSGVDGVGAIKDREMRQWVEGQFELIARRTVQAREAGLAVYVCYDALSLTRWAVDRNVAQLTCKHQAGRLCPASSASIERCSAALQQLLSHLPAVDGVVLRFGDSDATRLPYLVGNDIYQPHCARCRTMSMAQRICNVLSPFCQLVVHQMGKRLILRAWNVRSGGMHDSADLCRQVAEQFDDGLGPSDGERRPLVWSFKFTQTDFWRYQPWNESSLVASTVGRWPIIYELQCQREFEGKGGIPNWQVPLWRDGAPECGEQDVHGLAQVASKVTLAGLWAWVRGGGWGGPFVDSEAWIDANVFAVPILAERPDADREELARNWIRQRLSIDQPDLSNAIKRILETSPEVVLHAIYIAPYAAIQTDSWNPNGQWIQDDLVDVHAAWEIVQKLNESQLNQLISEKNEAVEQITSDRSMLQQLMNKENRCTIEPLVNTLLYAESLAASLRDLFAGLVAYRKYRQTRDAELGKLCHQNLQNAQRWWNHHTQRHGALPGTATAFRQVHFWEFTERVLTEVNGCSVRF